MLNWDKVKHIGDGAAQTSAAPSVPVQSSIKINWDNVKPTAATNIKPVIPSSSAESNLQRNLSKQKVVERNNTDYGPAQATDKEGDSRYYAQHPLADAIVHNPVSQFIDKKVLPVFDVAGQQMKGAVVGDYSPVNGRVETTGNKTLDTVAKTAGTIGAFALPMGGTSTASSTIRTGAERLASNLSPASSTIGKIAKRAAIGSIESAPYSIQQIATQKDLQNTEEGAKSILLNAALGSAGEVVVPAIAKGFSKLKSALKGNVPVNITETIPLEKVTIPEPQPSKTVSPSTIPGRYTPKNSALVQAKEDYNNAIEQIQNHFGTNELRIDEVKRIKSELGIDLDSLIARMEQAEKGIKLPNANSMQLKRAAGAASDKTYNLMDTLKAQKKTLPTPKQSEEMMTAGLENSKDKLSFKKVGPPIADIQNMELPKPQSNIVSSAKKNRLSIDGVKKALSNVYTLTWDSNNPLKKVDTEAYVKATNSKNVGGVVDYIYQDALVDAKGNQIGGSLQSVVRNIPKGKEDDFWQYMSQRHNIDRAREGKPVQENYTPQMSEEAVRRAELKNPEYKSIGNNITGWIDKFMRAWGVDAGTVDSEIYEGLRKTYKSYFPTQRDFSDLEKDGITGISKKFIDQKTPIRKATGSERDIINPVENIMNLVNSTVRTAKMNDVGQSLLKAVRKGKTDLAEIIPANEGAFANTDNVVSVLENGKPVYLRINDKALLDNLNNIGKASYGTIETIGKKVTAPYKQLITQKNPVFAVRNIARDIPSAYIYGSENNPLKFAKNLASAGKDLITNSEMAQKYRAVGGGGSNFFNSGNVAKSAKELVKGQGIVKRFGNAIEKINNITESAPRLAEFKTVLENTGDIDKALYAANDITTNFSRGGKVIKVADAWVPYLNAGFQGLDKMARSFNPKNPKIALATLIKGGIAVTAPTVFFHYLNKDNPNYKELDNRTKDNYYLIPNGDKFIKIPKSRELGVLFGALFDRILRHNEGDPDAWKGFLAKDGNPFEGTVGSNISPTNPIENNFLSPFVYNLPSNKDFAGRDIVPMSMQDISKKYQYDEKTSEIAKYIADKTNLSPKQIDYIIRSYTGVVGQMGLPAATKSNFNGNKLQNLLKPVTTQFVADPAYSNETMTDFYNKLRELQVKANDRDFLSGVSGKADTRQKTEEEKKVSEMNKYKKKIDEINKKIKSSNDDVEKRNLRLQMITIAKEALSASEKKIPINITSQNYLQRSSTLVNSQPTTKVTPTQTPLPNKSVVNTIPQKKPESTTKAKPYYGKGNIDLNNRPQVKNPDGSISTVFSMTVWPDDDVVQKYGNKFKDDKGKYILIPGVRFGLNRQMTNEEAWQWYQKTGEYLGKFNSDAEAEKYANTLHEDQADYYNIK